MAGICPAPGPDDPLVHGLISVVDCNVEALVQTGYATLFQPSGVFANVLTVILTLYVALVGYRLLLGRSQLNITDFALTAVKLGVVVALATQWSTYQTLVYRFLFVGPQQVANVVLHGFRAQGSAFPGDVFDGLQRAFTDLTAFSPATPPGGAAGAVAGAAPVGAAAAGLPGAGVQNQLSTLLSKSGFDAVLLLGSAVILLVSSLGVLLASKIVLGMLLATGPIFIALLLFDATRGVFEGWLRASLAFAFAPLAVTLMLGIGLTLLEPSLQQVEVMRDSNTYTPGVAFGVMVLVIVFAGVSLGMVAAGGIIAGGLKLPRQRGAATANDAAAPNINVAREAAALPRADRVAVSVAAQERRDASIFARSAPAVAAAGERRTTVSTSTVERAVREPAVEGRLGQAATRRNANPSVVRSGVRSGA